MAAIHIETGQVSPPPSPDPTEVVFKANMAVEDGQWRPLSSISHHGTLTTDTSKPENSEEGPTKREISLKSKSRVSIQAPTAPKTTADNSLSKRLSLPRDLPATARVASTKSHRVHTVKSRLRLRTASAKLERSAELTKAFATMDDRTAVTFNGIKESKQSEFSDRVCRPYSVYTVTKTCERLAISPFGGPLMNSAAGRYRERYLAKHRPDVAEKTPRDSVKLTFQRFYDNLDLLAINVKRIPFGTLRKPPPKQARTIEKQIESVPTQLHKYTSERVANLHVTMDRHDGNPCQSDGGSVRVGVMGVEYKVAMEVSSNLEKHRKSRPCNLPGLPAHFTVVRTDAPRLQSQTERFLTPGELSLKKGITSNYFDHERTKRGRVKAIEKPPRRVKSPPLSNLSRDKFLPEAQRLREQEYMWAELRIGRPVTPPASEYTNLQSTSFATTVRPLTAMTTRNGGSLSNASKSKSFEKENSDRPLPNQVNDTEKAIESSMQNMESENGTSENKQSLDNFGEDENEPNHQSALPDCIGNGNVANLTESHEQVTIPDDDGVPDCTAETNIDNHVGHN